MQQDKSFTSTPLFDDISKFLDLTVDQMARIQERRVKLKELTKKSKEALGLIKGLRTAIQNKHTALDERLSAIRNIATPQQTVVSDYRIEILYRSCYSPYYSIAIEIIIMDS